MITEAFFRRHAHAQGGNRELAMIDVAQEYILEHLRREGVFAEAIVFKGGTALRKFFFGQDGRLSLDLDLGHRTGEDWTDIVLDVLDGAELFDVSIRVERRKGPHARLRVDTPLGQVTEPIIASIRRPRAWLPIQEVRPQPFEFLDRGLEPEFERAPLPILDPREMAAEKVAAFSRRHHARDLYDLDQMLGRQRWLPSFTHILDLAGLKIYFDVVDEAQGTAVARLSQLFDVGDDEILGREDLGRLRAGAPDLEEMLRRCRDSLARRNLDEEIEELARTCHRADYGRALEAKQRLSEGLMAAS
jgi:predicted nucleotidyltransferase component of viral defense system